MAVALVNTDVWPPLMSAKRIVNAALVPRAPSCPQLFVPFSHTKRTLLVAAPRRRIVPPAAAMTETPLVNPTTVPELIVSVTFVGTTTSERTKIWPSAGVHVALLLNVPPTMNGGRVWTVQVRDRVMTALSPNTG